MSSNRGYLKPSKREEFSLFCKANKKLFKKIGKQVYYGSRTQATVMVAHLAGTFKQEKLLIKISTVQHHRVYKTTFKYRTRESKHLNYIAQNGGFQVRMALAQTKHPLPGEILAQLATDPNTYVRQAVARRKDINNIPILHALNVAETRAIILGNPHVEPELKKYL